MGEREEERERELPRLQPVINLTSTPGRYRFLLSSVRGGSVWEDGWRPRSTTTHPPEVFYDRVQPPDKKPVARCKEFPVRSKYPSFCTRVTSLPGNTDLFGPFPPSLLYTPSSSPSPPH